jgi:hypothetical protein
VLPWYVNGRLAAAQAASVDYAPQASLAKLMDRVAASENGRWRLLRFAGRRGREAHRRSGINLRSLLITAGAQSLIVALIVAGASWLMFQSVAPVRFQTLSEPWNVTPGSAGLVRVVFDDALPLSDVQALLRAVDGRIVDGPTASGVYTIERRPGAVHSDDAVAEWLRAQAGVRFAEPVARGN